MGEKSVKEYRVYFVDGFFTSLYGVAANVDSEGKILTVLHEDGTRSVFNWKHVVYIVEVLNH